MLLRRTGTMVPTPKSTAGRSPAVVCVVVETVNYVKVATDNYIVKDVFNVALI